MEERLLYQQVAETGRMLLEERLVARTWGNFSARLDETHFAITPSGLGYEQMTAEDIIRFCMTDGSFEGKHKPSSEKGIHAAAYRLFPETDFVIHTHQTYATALGLTPPENLSVTSAERERLGGIAWADYGLPGTKKLCLAVTAAMERGAHTVLMAHHGVLICGRNRGEALERAALLEEICRRSCQGQAETPAVWSEGEISRHRELLQAVFPTADIVETDAARAWSLLHKPLVAQIDDMAQMIGLTVPVAQNPPNAQAMLWKRNAVLLPGVGILVRGTDEEDTEALRVLTQKAAVAALHCRAAHHQANLGLFDSILMHKVYLLKYSKRKEG